MSYADAIAQVSQIESQIASLQTAFVAKTSAATATGTTGTGAVQTSAGTSSSTFATQLSQALAGQDSADSTGDGSDLASELTSGDGAGLSSLYAGGPTYPTTLSASGTTTSLGALASAGSSGSAAALPSQASNLLTSDQRQFASRLASDTGLDTGVVSAWLLAEESGGAATGRQSAGNNDWLNIGYTDGGTYGGADSVWSDPVTAADATAGWLKGQNTIPGYGTASSGVQAILGTAGQPAAAQIAALQTSGWASSGYPDLSSLYAQVTA